MIKRIWKLIEYRSGQNIRTGRMVEVEGSNFFFGSGHGIEMVNEK